MKILFLLFITNWVVCCNNFTTQNKPLLTNEKMEKMNEKDTSFEDENDIIIPNYQPLSIPYSEWQAYRGRELLTANQYEDSARGWRRAAQHPNGLIRSTAFYLLAHDPDRQDMDFFTKHIDDIDESVQTYCALGLYQLGDETMSSRLKAIANLDVDAHVAACQAAGVLGQLKMTEGYSTILKALDSELDYINLFGIENAFFFVPLHGEKYDERHQINIWELYRAALENKNSGIRSLARAQLKELNSDEAKKLLQE